MKKITYNYKKSLEVVMLIENIQNFSSNLPYLFFPLLFLIAFLLFRATRFVFARLSYRIALKTETIYDDLFVDRLQPFRFSWLLPLLLIFFYTDLLFPDYLFLKKAALVLTIVISTDFLIAILSGINDVYKKNPRYTGVSVAGYIGLLKVLAVVAAIVLIISYLTDIDPVTLLSGVGTWLAVLLLIFRDTILSFLASIQISTLKLLKEGDWIDVPSFNASGTITEINLQTILVQNWDNTISTIPTSKIVDTGFKNYRRMIESGARRLKSSILIDINSLKFLDAELVKRLGSIKIIQQEIGDILLTELPQTTNLQLMIRYAQQYLSNRKEVRQRRYPMLIHPLETNEYGIPLEVYVFVKAANWEKFEEIQTDIMLHLMAILPYFDLKTSDGYRVISRK
jgi:miniconductance mechanosensitive channel